MLTNATEECNLYYCLLLFLNMGPRRWAPAGGC